MDREKYKIYDNVRIELWCENPKCTALKDVGEDDYRITMDASEWLVKIHTCNECSEELKTQYDTNIKEQLNLTR